MVSPATPAGPRIGAATSSSPASSDSGAAIFSRKYPVDPIEPHRDADVLSSYGIAACVMKGGIDRISMLIMLSSALEAQTASQSSLPPAAQQAAVPATRVFAADAGIVLSPNHAAHAPHSRVDARPHLPAAA